MWKIVRIRCGRYSIIFHGVLQTNPEKGYIAPSSTFFKEEFEIRLKVFSPIAVVSMAGVFPGANTLEQFWQHIVEKRDACQDIPENRWVADPAQMVSPLPASDKAFHRRGCLIDNFHFDANGFAVPADMLQSLDPLHHLVLHAGRQAFTSFVSDKLDKTRIGVILAAIALPTESSSLLAREILGTAFKNALFQKHSDPSFSPTINQFLSSQVTAFPAAVLARSLELGGPAFTLDAACASSLYAVKLACDMLHDHRCDAVLAGGVSRPDCLYTQVGFSQLRALSVSGRCAPFDARADGLVVGEGVGILALKRLNDAVKDGDTIHGVIRGIGLSNDMRGNLLAPDTEGQLRAMQAAYQSAGWRPTDVDIIECHGAGTPVGDAVELQSIKLLWENAGSQSTRCPIGSIKSMIGHLLTAAGAAGLIKILLAIRHQTLPPSLNFSAAAASSPLNDSPFHVQTQAETWHHRNADTPRRAAISAFGFGGINAHVLIEEWAPRMAEPEIESLRTNNMPIEISHLPDRRSLDIAVIGMDACFGKLHNLRSFQEAVLSGRSAIQERPNHRWKGCDDLAAAILGFPELPGGYIEAIMLELGELHIPPNEIPDILAQHLLMLQVARRAMSDGGYPTRKLRPRMGAVIGMGFDMEATDYHVRWSLNTSHTDWLKQAGIRIEGSPKMEWLESLKNDFGPALTAPRTLGALAGIVASRVAREFGLGAPSFTVSADAVSGLVALDIAARLLQNDEADAMLVGAVDMAGDVRSVLMANGISPFSPTGKVCSFDKIADGTLPGEGAAALILKRRDQAIADGDRIYAVIKGVGFACTASSDDVSAYSRALRQSLDEAGISPAAVGYYEAHGSGQPVEDDLETKAIHAVFQDASVDIAVGSVKPIIGHAGAAAGLASLVKTCLCLYQEVLPPLAGYVRPPENRPWESRFHLPAFPQYWTRNRHDGPRRACCAALSSTGACGHVVFESHETAVSEQERMRPLGLSGSGLFIVEGKDIPSLILGLSHLDRHIQNALSPIEEAARSWFREHPLSMLNGYAVSLIAESSEQLLFLISEAKEVVQSGTQRRFSGRSGLAFSPHPMGGTGEIAFVFPGSGNHYVGMGRTLAVTWPDILRGMDAETQALKTQMVPAAYMPFRQSWEPGWEAESMAVLSADPLIPIYGQVVFGSLMTRLITKFGIHAQAVIGYSLGETAGLFALGAWPDRGEMLTRLAQSPLFRTELTGPCHAARKAWNLDPDVPFTWKVAAVNRPSETVRQILPRFPLARLLIVNTPDECVVGGDQPAVEGVIRALNCEAVYLEGVVTVHCDAAVPVRKAYRALHRFPTAHPTDIRFYSCALNRAYSLNTESAADSITRQAISGFDFPAAIQQAYSDGVRIFLEMGPHASCTRMISRILDDQPHLALSANSRGEDEMLSLLKLLGTLAAERIPINLEALYGQSAYPVAVQSKERIQVIPTGGHAFSPQFPQTVAAAYSVVPLTEISDTDRQDEQRQTPGQPTVPDHFCSSAPVPYPPDIVEGVTRNTRATADAHDTFLNFSNAMMQDFANVFGLQTRLLHHQMLYPESDENNRPFVPTDYGLTMVPLPLADHHFSPTLGAPPATEFQPPHPAYPRSLCMEFAVGSVAKVLGPEFAEVDTFPARVRLPDEPLMLVDRILNVEGSKGLLGPGRVVTEHDVLPGAWYLDGGHAPVCISVEAGQADLFLCAYLGIDLQVRGLRTYRLLDAAVQFHRGLPAPGDVIRYEIEIERFVRQGDTWLFFFHFQGFIGQDLLITMKNGCAGFFTEMEVKNSGGIILTEAEQRPEPGKMPSDWKQLVPQSMEAFTDHEVDALRSGDLAGCFGAYFSGKTLSESLWLPGNRMRLIDRILTLDPKGGRYGLGMIQAQADIHPDDWFLTCHFMDDPVMPGTLMYECCAHTLRVFIQRMGWVTDKPGVCYEPVTGINSILKCRGPVTPATRHVVYQVDIREIGYAPEPYVIADAQMFADGRHIVMFRDLSLKMTGISREEIESCWDTGAQYHEQEMIPPARQQGGSIQKSDRQPSVPDPPHALYGREQILALAIGKPSEAFGETFRIFDRDRFLARLPGPPFMFVDRIVTAEPPAFFLKPGGWITAEYDFSPSEWYFSADRSGIMPYAVLLEIALQPCGWLAAYSGSALISKKDLRFRNLGGSGRIYRDVFPVNGMLTMKCRLTQVSAAADMIIESFDFSVASEKNVIYEGQTTFGFFTETALTQQKGLSKSDDRRFRPDDLDPAAWQPQHLEDAPPFFPESVVGPPPIPQMAMPARALRMMDVIEYYDPQGGPSKLGYVRGLKRIDPDEWFFNAHFYQDPVWPGSLGIEAFMQLLKFMAGNKWPDLTSRYRFSLVTGTQHTWTYRGQVIPGNKQVTVEAGVTRITETPEPLIMADGFLRVDGLAIYEMKDFGIRLVPAV